MMNNSIRLWFVGGDVGWTMKTSSPRTFSSIFAKVSPSGKGLIVHLPNSMPMELQIDLLRGGLAVPLKIFTIVTLGSEQKNPPDAGGKSDRESTTRAALRNGKFQFLSSSSSFSSSPSNLF